MKRKFRLTRSTEFKRVRRSGKSLAHSLVVLIAMPNELAYSRVAVSASRAVGGAVKRNFAKRRLRMCISQQARFLAPGWDMILMARKPVISAPFSEVQTAVAGLLRRARLIVSDEHNLRNQE